MNKEQVQFDYLQVWKTFYFYVMVDLLTASTAAALLQPIYFHFQSLEFNLGSNYE